MNPLKSVSIFILPFLFFPTISFSQMPPHSHKNIFGTGWDCNRGYYRLGNECKKVIVPKNAHINIMGNGWDCDRGYYRLGNECKKVIVPKNAHINIMGNGWDCDRGYLRSGNKCRPMTIAERKKQKELEEAILKQIEERRSKGVSGDDCETEYKTGAEVCVEVNNADLDCDESYMGNYYDNCEVTVYYELNTDYKGGSYLDVEVRCEVEIEYTGRNTYGWSSESEYRDESHSLYAHGSDSNTITLDFSFSAFEEVTNVKIDSVHCEIESVDLW